MVNIDRSALKANFKAAEAALPKKQILVKTGRDMTTGFKRFVFNILEAIGLFRHSIASYYKNKSAIVLSGLNKEFVLKKLDNANEMEFDFLRKQRVVHKSHLLSKANLDEIGAAHQFYKFISSTELLLAVKDVRDDQDHWVVQLLEKLGRTELINLFKSVNPEKANEALAKLQRIPNINDLIKLINKMHAMEATHPLSFQKDTISKVLDIVSPSLDASTVDYKKLEDVLALYEVNLRDNRNPDETVPVLMKNLAAAEAAGHPVIRDQLFVTFEKNPQVQDQFIRNPNTLDRIINLLDIWDFEETLRLALRIDQSQLDLSEKLKEITNEFGAGIAEKVEAQLKLDNRVAQGFDRYNEHKQWNIISARLEALTVLKAQFKDMPKEEFQAEIARFTLEFAKAYNKSWFISNDNNPVKSLKKHLKMVSFFKPSEAERSTIAPGAETNKHWARIYKEAKALLKDHPNSYSAEILGPSLTKIVEEKKLTLKEVSMMFDFSAHFTDERKMRLAARERFQRYMLDAYILKVAQGTAGLHLAKDQATLVSIIAKEFVVSDKFAKPEALLYVKEVVEAGLKIQQEGVSLATTLAGLRNNGKTQFTLSDIDKKTPAFSKSIENVQRLVAKEAKIERTGVPPVEERMFPLLLKLFPVFGAELLPADKKKGFANTFAALEKLWESKAVYQADLVRLKRWLETNSINDLLANDPKVNTLMVQFGFALVPKLLNDTIDALEKSGTEKPLSNSDVARMFQKIEINSKENNQDEVTPLVLGVFTDFFNLVNEVRAKKVTIDAYQKLNIKPTIVVLKGNEVEPTEPVKNTVYLTETENAFINMLPVIVSKKQTALDAIGWAKFGVNTLEGLGGFGQWLGSKVGNMALNKTIHDLVSPFSKDRQDMIKESIPFITEIALLLGPELVKFISKEDVESIFSLIEYVNTIVNSETPVDAKTMAITMLRSVVDIFEIAKKLKQPILAVAQNTNQVCAKNLKISTPEAVSVLV